MATAVATFASSRRHSRLLTTSLVVCDVLFLVFAALVAGRANHVPMPAFLGAGVLALSILAVSGTYRRSFGGSMRDEWYAVGAALALVAAPLMLLTFFLPAFYYGRTEIAEFAGIALRGIAASRTMVHRIRVRRRFAVVGVPERIDLALMHLRPRRDDALLRLPVGNIESTLESDL